jgi:hypothetical protein
VGVGAQTARFVAQHNLSLLFFFISGNFTKKTVTAMSKSAEMNSCNSMAGSVAIGFNVTLDVHCTVVNGL